MSLGGLAKAIKAKWNLSAPLHLHLAPQDTSSPYASFFFVGGISKDTFNTMTDEIRVQFSLFSSARSSEEVWTLYEQLEQLFDYCELEVADAGFIEMRRITVPIVRRDPDDGWWQLTVDYKVILYKGEVGESEMTLLMKFLWGDGSDGDYEQDGGEVIAYGVKNYRNFTLKNGAIYRNQNYYDLPYPCRYLSIRVSGTLHLSGNSVIKSSNKLMGNGGHLGVVTGQGDPGDSPFTFSSTVLSASLLNPSPSGASGGGAGSSSYKGGAGSGYFYPATMSASNILIGANGPAGGNGIGTNALIPSNDIDFKYIANDFDYFSCPWLLGINGGNGGSGGCASLGTGTPGAPGDGGGGGEGGGFLDIRAHTAIIEEGSSINCDGADGDNGEDATNSSNANAVAGGGGAGSGGSGGTIKGLFHTIAAASKIRITAKGGIGGIGGAGVGGAGAGGNGMPTGDFLPIDGLVAITVLGG